MKRAFLFFILTVLSLTLLCACNQIENGDSSYEVEGNIRYYIKDDGTYLAVISSSSELTSFYIPDKRNEAPISEVWIEGNVTCLPKSAFADSVSLESLTVGELTTNIEAGALSACQNLESLTIHSLNGSLGELFSDNSTEDVNASVPKSLKKVSLGKGITKIVSYAFRGCTSLTSISLPESVVSIGDGIFEGCENLEYSEHGGAYYIGNSSNPYLFLVKARDKEITSCSVNAGTRFILDEAFSGCSLLEAIEMNDRISTVCNRAFADCTSLQAITMPNSMEVIGAGVFENCESLKYNKNSSGLYLGNDTNPYLMLAKAYPADGFIHYLVDENTKFILDGAFQNVEFTFNLIIPESVIYICSLAFENCTGRLSAIISIPEEVSVIKADAFKNCTRIDIWCEAVSKPDGWDENWNSSECSVTWDGNDIKNPLSPFN